MRRQQRNRASARRAQKPVFDPDFWEVPLSRIGAGELPESRGLWYESPAEVEDRLGVEPLPMELLRELVAETLTPRQREVVERYFFEEMTEAEIADDIGVRRQVVAQHLYGVMRAGRRVGGAMARLRKEARRRGIVPR
jgi:predicted DNA-binding protein YlxM (UPF0122 family)